MANVTRNIFKKLINNNFNIQQVRYYPRWNHRQPKKVYTPEEYEKMEQKLHHEAPLKTQQSSKNDEKTVLDKYGGLNIKWKEETNKSKDIKYNIKPKKAGKVLTTLSQKSKPSTTDMLETVIDDEGNFVYTKMANHDHRVGIILTEVKSKNEKQKRDLVLLEGKRLIKDALQSGCQLKYIIFSRKTEVEYLKPYLPKLGASLYKMPYKEMQLWSNLTTNPGIMGIFKIPDISNYEPKESIPLTIICDNIREPGNLGSILRVCAGVGCARIFLTKGCVNLWDTKVLRSSAGAHFRLQIHSNLEWEDIKKEIDSDSGIYLADNRIISDFEGDKNNFIEVAAKLPVIPYYGVHFSSNKHTFLIVGGETFGLSKTSYEIASEVTGARLNVPLSNEIESLNVGAALGIIAFEIKRQLAVSGVVDVLENASPSAS